MIAPNGGGVNLCRFSQRTDRSFGGLPRTYAQNQKAGLTPGSLDRPQVKVPSESPDHADDPAAHRHLLRRHRDRLHGAVGGLQPDLVALHVEVLQRDLFFLG